MSEYTLDVHGLIKWLETQDPATTYAWFSVEDCLIIRFARAMGFQGSYSEIPGVETDPIEPRMNLMVLAAINLPYTYGAALARARKFVEKLDAQSS